MSSRIHHDSFLRLPRRLSQFSLRLAAVLALLTGIAFNAAHAAASPRPPLAAAKVATQLDGKININTASADQLRLLPGIGPATAAKILAYRMRRPFGQAAHLLRIKGIGRKTYAAIRRFIIVEGETTLHVPADP